MTETVKYTELLSLFIFQKFTPTILGELDPSLPDYKILGYSTHMYTHVCVYTPTQTQKLITQDAQ